MKSAWEEAPQLKSPCSQLGLHIYVSSSKYAYVLGFLVKRLYKEHFEPPHPSMPFLPPTILACVLKEMHNKNAQTFLWGL